MSMLSKDGTDSKNIKPVAVALACIGADGGGQPLPWCNSGKPAVAEGCSPRQGRVSKELWCPVARDEALR